MIHARIVTALGLAAMLVALPSPADAQNRRGPSTGRAVPRTGPAPRSGAVRTYRPSYNRPTYYRPSYRPYYYSPLIGYGGFYGPYAYGYAFGYPAYGYSRYGYPGYGYSAYGYSGYGYSGYGYPGYGYGGGYQPYGGVRIDIPQRDAQVYVDGYYAGIVDDFDGTFQQLRLEPGPHRIEIRAADATPISFEVNVEPGRTITYRSALPTVRP